MSETPTCKKLTNPNHPGVIREIIGSEVHVPHGMPSILMLMFRDTYPSGHIYHGSQTEEGMKKWGWVLDA